MKKIVDHLHRTSVLQLFDETVHINEEICCEGVPMLFCLKRFRIEIFGNNMHVQLTGPINDSYFCRVPQTWHCMKSNTELVSRQPFGTQMEKNERGTL